MLVNRRIAGRFPDAEKAATAAFSFLYNKHADFDVNMR
jgi:hypothetical protein